MHVYSGSGLITVATHPTNHAALHSRCPEAMVIDINDTKMLTKMIEATDSILIGPGLGVDFKGNNAITFLLPKYSTTSKSHCRWRCNYNI